MYYTPRASEALRLLISDNGMGPHAQKPVFKQGINAYQSIRVTVVMVISITLSRVYIFENHSPYKSLRFECRHACPTVTLENPKSEKVCETTVTTVTFEILVF